MIKESDSLARQIHSMIGKSKNVFVWIDANKEVKSVAIDKSMSARFNKKIPGFVGIYDRLSSLNEIQSDIIRRVAGV